MGQNPTMDQNPTTVSYADAIQVARDLTENGSSTQDNPEYTRGIVELLKDCFGYRGVDGGERAEQIEADINGSSATAADEFTLTIELGNDAMQTGRDIAQALEELSQRLLTYTGPGDGVIIDENGNTIGKWEIR